MSQQADQQGRRRQVIAVLLLIGLIATIVGAVVSSTTTTRPERTSSSSSPSSSSPSPTTDDDAAPVTPSTTPDPGSSDVVVRNAIGRPPVVDSETFGVKGSLAGGLAPGNESPLDLELSNPNDFPIHVVDVTVRISSDKAACPDDTLRVSQGGAVKPGNVVSFAELVVPAKTTRTLSALGVPASERVALRFPNSDANQDACKSTNFSLTYTGTATA